MVKDAWWGAYTSLPATFDQVIQSWDTANKSTELSDYSVCTTWGLKARKIYLLNVLRKRMNYPDLKRAVRIQAAAFHPQVILIEDKASGTPLIQELRREGMGGVQACKYDKDKVMRLNTQTAIIEHGAVYLPKQAPWLAEYRLELGAFPRARHDDQVDSTSQALAWIQNSWRTSDSRVYIVPLRKSNPMLGEMPDEDDDEEPTPKPPAQPTSGKRSPKTGAQHKQAPSTAPVTAEAKKPAAPSAGKQLKAEKPSPAAKSKTEAKPEPKPAPAAKAAPAPAKPAAALAKKPAPNAKSASQKAPAKAPVKAAQKSPVKAVQKPQAKIPAKTAAKPMAKALVKASAPRPAAAKKKAAHAANAKPAMATKPAGKKPTAKPLKRR